MRAPDRLASVLAVALLLIASRTDAQPLYRGMCDASAAIAIGSQHFVVADDEGDVLRVYSRSAELPVASVDLAKYLKNENANGKRDEADIEGAARVGNRIYWISSHARKGKDGELDRHRRRFFATEIDAAATPPAVVPAKGVPYERLLDDLLADARYAWLAEAEKRKPEADGGLNIEGLAAQPDGSLLIGFRNPLLNGRALVAPLRNPIDVVDRGAVPRFGDPMRLDLGGRAIRSIERVGNEIFIAAGPVGTADASPVQPAFALFRWSGAAADAPVFAAPLDAGTFRPEALFHDPESNELVLLSDDGDESIAGRECKSKSVPSEEKRFRARRLPLPLPPLAAECQIDRSAAFAGVKLVLARRSGLAAAAGFGVFRAPFAVNTDGAPTSYHPEDYTGQRLALNHLDNALVIQATSGAPLTVAQRIEVFNRWRSADWRVPDGFRITWKNVIAASPDGKPCVFAKDNPGYFGSLTGLRNGLIGTDAGECGVHDQLDQRFVPALVLRGQANPLRSWGAAVGDLALAINPTTGVVVPAIIGDSGDGDRIGEGSIALNRALLTGAPMPSNYRESRALDTGTRKMIAAVFPGTRAFERARPHTRENIAERLAAWARTQGYDSVLGLAAQVMHCSQGI